MTRYPLRARAIVAAMLLVTVHVGASLVAAQSTAHAQTIDEARGAFLRGLAAKDTSFFRVAFTDDAVTLFAQTAAAKTNFGLAQIQQFYADLFGRVSNFLEMKFVQLEVVRGKSVAVETGTWTMPAFQTAGTYRMTYSKDTADRWRITYWHASPATP